MSRHHLEAPAEYGANITRLFQTRVAARLRNATDRRGLSSQARLSRDRPAASIEDYMNQFNDDDVRDRAFRLWEAAGKPSQKVDEFWYEAERQLQGERISHELKIPDTL
jgi:hypothetical protein